uniref:Uncharacterized protein n=1 Tax=Arundo donax TaxID=35708 RepID=A0A0A9BFP2_ARUDO
MEKQTIPNNPEQNYKKFTPKISGLGE